MQQSSRTGLAGNDRLDSDLGHARGATRPTSVRAHVVVSVVVSARRPPTGRPAAGGRSTRRCTDWPSSACLQDLDAVLAARGVDSALLVGWSYGGILSWH